MSQSLSLFQRASEHVKRCAIISEGNRYTYRHLLDDAAKVATALLAGKESLNGERIALMMPPSFDFAATLWGTWMAGGVAVPLCLSHPLPSLEYTLTDTGASHMIASEAYIDFLSPLSQKLSIPIIAMHELDDEEEYQQLPKLSLDMPALILYTSGTTSLPKGVVITHGNIESQIQSLAVAWKWNANDHILSILPLHHVHGLINVVTSSLWSGAICEFIPKPEPALIWDHICHGQANLFMAVPTIYIRLIKYWKNAPEELKAKMSSFAKEFRLMVSGSAALPVSTLEEWAKITGHTLLERYGMTEIGMALSNPYDGPRLAGRVGQPLPNVELRLINEAGEPATEGEEGEIQVKGPNVFKEYWNKPEATQKAFTEDGWFLTGDIATCESGSFRILGRSSVDIIKSGGYKISALEIEEALRKHPSIQECGVVGIANEEWGEVVLAGLVSADGTELSLSELRKWAKERLPAYKVPKGIKYFEDLPRNALGKVTKPLLKEWLTS